LGKIPALKDVTLKINRGEQASIIGSNGSGKSTLLAILNGLIYPTSGEFYAFDNQITEEVFDSFRIQMFSSFRPRSSRRLLLDPCSSTFLPREVRTRVEDILEIIDLISIRAIVMG